MTNLLFKIIKLLLKVTNEFTKGFAGHIVLHSENAKHTKQKKFFINGLNFNK